MKHILVLLCVLASPAFFATARAGTVTTTVKLPTKYTDGTTIDAPITLRLEGGYEGQPLIELARSATPVIQLANMAAGRWCNRVIVMVNSVDADPSDTVCVTIPPPELPLPAAKKPNPAYSIVTTAAP